MVDVRAFANETWDAVGRDRADWVTWSVVSLFTLGFAIPLALVYWAGIRPALASISESDLV